MPTRVAPVQGPVQRQPNPEAEENPRHRRRGGRRRRTNPDAEENPRRRRRGGRRRRTNPKNPKISYTQGALIGAVLGSIGVAISAASKSPMPVVTTDAGSFAVSTESTAVRATKGALRGAALGLAVGLALTAVARELKVGAAGRMMNPSGPGTALILGSTVGATTLALDAGYNKAFGK